MFEDRGPPLSEVRDGALGRVVEVRHGQHSDVVVWNPGAELIRSMPDLADDAHPTFVCVETARLSRAMGETASDGGSGEGTGTGCGTSTGCGEGSGEGSRLSVTLTVR